MQQGLLAVLIQIISEVAEENGQQFLAQILKG